MKAIKKDTRAFDRMVELKETYTTLSEKLRQEGYIFNARMVYRYLTGKAVPTKPVKKAIAKVLRCLPSDIF